MKMRMEGSGNPGELDFVKRTWVGILTSTFDPTASFKSLEDLGMSDEWWATLENTQNSFERVSRV